MAVHIPTPQFHGGMTNTLVSCCTKKPKHCQRHCAALRSHLSVQGFCWFGDRKLTGGKHIASIRLVLQKSVPPSCCTTTLKARWLDSSNTRSADRERVTTGRGVIGEEAVNVPFCYFLFYIQIS
jgi:hypothetical protein